MQYLSWAYAHDLLDGLSQNKLAQTLGLDPMMISNILTLLEKKKYIIRQKSQAMLTGMKLSLSKTGQVVIDKAHKAVEEIEQVLSDTKEPKKLKKNLRKIIDTL